MFKRLPANIEYLLLFANLLIRALFVVFPFWGLEYEDAFVYNDTGRLMNYDYQYSSNWFSAQSCTDGSYLNCRETESFGGHFLPFPFLLSKFNAIFGYNHFNIFIFNFSLSTILLLTVFIWHKTDKLSKEFSLKLFLILMMITPFVTVFQTSGLAETFSSLLVVLCLIFMVKWAKQHFSVLHYTFWISFLLLSFSFLIKRENLLLGSLFFIIPISQKNIKKAIKSKYWILLIFYTITAIYLAKEIGLFNVEVNETIDIQTNTFSALFLIRNLKQFAIALFDFNYWGVTGVIFIVTLLLLPFKNSVSNLGKIAIVLSVLYILLYSTHYRSYYQVHYDEESPFETLRYAVNYFPIICIFISGMNFNRFGIWFSNSKKVLMPIGIVFLIGSTIFAIRTRVNFSKIEYAERIKPVEETISLVNKSDIIITDLPIVFHCFVSESQEVVDYYSLSKDRLHNLIQNRKGIDVYLIKQRENSIDSLRYKSSLRVFDHCFERINIENKNLELIKFCNNAVEN